MIEILRENPPMYALDRIPEADIWCTGGIYTPILVVDDEEFNILSVLRAAKSVKVVNPIVAASDGSQALQVLRGWLAARTDLPPVIILLDWNMPNMNGMEFLEEIREDPSLKQAHVFVHSSSSSPSQVAAAYDQNVAGYIVKRNEKSSTEDVLRMLVNYAICVHFAG